MQGFAPSPGAKSPLCKRCQIVYNKKLDLLVHFSKYKIMRAVFRRREGWRCPVTQPLRRTKIVCTMGPNLFEKGLIKPLMLAGMDVARFNFSHDTRENHLKRYQEVCRLREELGLPVATMLDTKGPEIRIGTFGKTALPWTPGSCSP